MKKLIILFLFTFISFFGNSQTIKQQTSSLLDSINKYKFIDSKKSLDFGFSALEISGGIVSIETLEINEGLGELLFYQNNFAKSLDYYTDALNIYNLLPKNQRRHKYVIEPPWTLVALGNLYYKIERFEIAKMKYLEAIDNFNLFEEEFLIEKFNGLNTSKNNLALVYSSLGDFQKAESQYKEVLESRKKTGKKSVIIFQYMMMMQFYYKFNMHETGDDLYDLATSLYNELKYSNKGDSLEEIKIWYSYVLSVYGSNLLKLKKIKQALISLNESKKIIVAQNHNTTVYPDVNLEIAKCYYELQSYNKAENALVESLSSDNLVSEPKPINFNFYYFCFFTLNIIDCR